MQLHGSNLFASFSFIILQRLFINGLMLLHDLPERDLNLVEHLGAEPFLDRVFGLLDDLLLDLFGKEEGVVLVIGIVGMWDLFK